MKPPFRVRWETEIAGCARDAADVAGRAQDMLRDPDCAANVFTVIDGDGVETVVDFEEAGGRRSSTYRAYIARNVVHIIAVDIDDMAMDCEDDDRVHVWVVVATWGPRRAVLVQGTQFAEAAGCAPETLPGRHFYADLRWGAPSFEHEQVERIEFGRLVECPPIEQVIAELEGRQSDG